jgi:hypothetical protein
MDAWLQPLHKGESGALSVPPSLREGGEGAAEGGPPGEGHRGGPPGEGRRGGPPGEGRRRGPPGRAAEEGRRVGQPVEGSSREALAVASH